MINANMVVLDLKMKEFDSVEIRSSLIRHYLNTGRKTGELSP